MDIIKNLYLHKYTHKMFYKSRQNQSNGTSRRSSPTTNNNSSTRPADIAIRAQSFYIFTVDSARNSNTQPALDLPPKYEDVIKDPHLYRTTRQVA